MGAHTTYYAYGVMYYPDNTTEIREIQVPGITSEDAKHEAIRQGMLQIFTIKHWSEVEGDDY